MPCVMSISPEDRGIHTCSARALWTPQASPCAQGARSCSGTRTHTSSAASSAWEAAAALPHLQQTWFFTGVQANMSLRSPNQAQTCKELAEAACLAAMGPADKATRSA